MNNAHRIATELDARLTRPTQIIVFGSSALHLDPTHTMSVSNRPTNGIDVIVPDKREIEVEADKQFGDAINSIGHSTATIRVCVLENGPIISL